MAAVLRGDIHWADLDPTQGREQSGRWPVLILSEDIFNARSGTVIAVAVTSQEPQTGFPLTMEIVGTGLPKRSWVKISQIRTLSSSVLVRNWVRVRRRNGGSAGWTKRTFGHLTDGSLRDIAKTVK